LSTTALFGVLLFEAGEIVEKAVPNLINRAILAFFCEEIVILDSDYETKVVRKGVIVPNPKSF